MDIFGAGIAGLLAGCHFQRATIWEAGSAQQTQHRAVLRFRTSAVGDAVGVEFRRVRVRKGIWYDGAQHPASIRAANWYARKCVGTIVDRSIWALEAVDRFVAPPNFLEQLVERCAGRIRWDTAVQARQALAARDVAVSTLPMSVMVEFVRSELGAEWEHETPEFRYATIVVRRWRVTDADVHQTLYFPEPGMPLYRASITGDLLIAEYIGPHAEAFALREDQWELFEAFGLREADCVPLDNAAQRFGKIAPIDDRWRKRFIWTLTQRYRVYSLGRFGTWRNVLVDDVLHDISVIKRLMNTTSYDHSRFLAR